MKLALETKGLAKTYLAGTPQEVQAPKPTDCSLKSENSTPSSAERLREIDASASLGCS